MAHTEGWIDAYGALEEGREMSPALLDTVLSNRNGIGETMLHWYAIEGSPEILRKIIALGFDVNTVNKFGATPLCECARIGRWEIVEMLLAHGARTNIRDHNGEDVFDVLEQAGERKSLRKLKDLEARLG